MTIESWIVGTLSRALAYGTPLLLGTLGEIYAERAGVLNLGIEGMMILGAFSGFAATYVTGNVYLGLLTASLVGGLASLIHGFLSITLGRNQVVSGLALTMFGLGLAGLLGRGWEGKPLPVTFPEITIPHLTDIPYLGPILFTDQNALVYLGLFLAPLLWFFLFKTRAGNSIRSVGENPSAADALGVNVWRIRYLCVFFGGLLSGLAGGYLSIVYRPAWTEGMTAGMGWIVIALTIFAFWNPLYGMLGAYFFGGLYHLSYRLQPWISPEVLKAMPYTFAILVLVFAFKATIKKKVGMPSALCQPYRRGES